MRIKRWDYNHKEYIEVKVPSDWNVKVIAGNDELVNCVTCGRNLTKVDVFTSLEVMNAFGTGFLVCPYCHDSEVIRRTAHVKEATEFDWEIIKDGYVYRKIHGTVSYAHHAASIFGGTPRKCEEWRREE